MEIPKNTDKEEATMKDCLLIANSNAVTYKEVFPLIKSNQLRWGYNWVKTFIDTEGNEKPFGNICWFVTLPTTNKKKLILTQSYDPNKYPKYDNYNAIEVSRIKDIPYDYEGVMGVPITILGYDLENVEIMGEEVIHNKDTKIEGKEKYRRVLIKKKFEIEGIMSGAKGEELTNGNDGRAKFYVKDKSVYARVLIKKNFEIMQLCASHGKTPRGIENENCYMNGKWKYPRILIRRKTE